MKHQLKLFRMIKYIQYTPIAHPARWFGQLFAMVVACFFILSLNIAQAGTVEYYTFLATKEDGGTKLSAAPSLTIDKLFNLKSGNYYLHMIGLDRDTGQWLSYSYKITLKDEKLPKKGVMIAGFQSLTNAVASQSIVERDIEGLSYINGKLKGDILPSFLRKLVLSNTKSSLFIGSNFRIHRIHKMTDDQLNHQTLQNLWRMWDPKLQGYDPKESTSKNMEVLEKSIENSEEENGFIYSSTNSPTSEQAVLKKYFLRFVEELRVNYNEKIKPLKDDYLGADKELRKKLDAASKAEIVTDDLLVQAKEKGIDLNLIQKIGKNVQEAKKKLSVANQEAKKSKKQFKADNFKKATVLAKGASKNADKAKVETELISNEIKGILNIPEPNIFGKWIVGIILIPLFVLGALILIMPTFSQKFLRAVGFKIRKEENEKKDMGTDGNNGGNNAHTPLPVSGNQQQNNQPPAISPTEANLKNNDNISHNLEGNYTTQYNQEIYDLREKVEKLKRENKGLEDMNRLKDKELRRIANERSFFETLFANNDVRYLIEEIVNDKVQQEVDKKIIVKLREFYHQFPGLKQLQKKALPASNPQNIDNTNNGTNQLTGKQENIRIETVNETSQQIETNYSENEGLFGVLVESTIIRKTEMQRDFSTVIKDDLFLAKSIPGWMKSKMPPSLYRQLDTELAKYKKGKIRLVIPDIDDVFNPEDHELTATREKEMRGTGGRVSKVIKPGIKMRAEKGGSSIISRAQVEIKT